MIWVIIAVVALWYILGVVYLLNQMISNQSRLSVTDVVVGLAAGTVGLIIALADCLDRITIYRKKW